MVENCGYSWPSSSALAHREVDPAQFSRQRHDGDWPAAAAGRRDRARGSLFPRVDVALVGLDHRIVRRVAIDGNAAVLLETMPQLQQVLLRSWLSSRAMRAVRGGLGDAVEDQYGERAKPGVVLGCVRPDLDPGVSERLLPP